MLLSLLACAATTHRVVTVTLPPEGATPPAVVVAASVAAPAADPAATIVASAARFAAGEPLIVDGRRYRDDCSGLVEAAVAAAGGAWAGSSASLYAAAKEAGLTHRHARPGDVAFFDNTYDRDGDRRLDDRLTHIAIVESIARDGTMILIHRGSRGVTRIRMNLRHRHWRDDGDGTVLNDYLRSRSDRDRPRTKYLAGELWVRFGRLADQIEGPSFEGPT